MLKSWGWDCASGYVVLCKRLCGAVQAAMWWCASGYVVVAHEILVSAQGPFLGFWVWGLGVWGLGLTIINGEEK